MITDDLSFDRIMELMVAHPNDVKVVTEGAKALQDKSKRDESQDMIILAGVHIQLVRSIAMHPSVVKLCEYASHAISFMADGPDGPRSAALIEAGAGPLLAAVAQTHSGETKEKAEDALRGLGLRSDGTSTVYVFPVNAFVLMETFVKFVLNQYLLIFYRFR